jgi:hypothetical protein
MWIHLSGADIARLNLAAFDAPGIRPIVERIAIETALVALPESVAYRCKGREAVASEDCKIDARAPVVSDPLRDGGAWVMGWQWVAK